MAGTCQKCKRKLEDYDNFCPWCGAETSVSIDGDYSIPQASKTGAKTALSLKLSSFKVSRWRDAVIGLVAVIIMTVFITAAAAEYFSNKTYQACATAYLTVAAGQGSYKDLVDAVGEDLFKTAVSSYYELDTSDIKSGAESLINELKNDSTEGSFDVTVKLSRELDDIDLLAYKRSKSDSFGSGFLLEPSGGYELEVTKTYSDGTTSDAENLVVLMIDNEWCTYDALELLSQAAAASVGK